MIKGWLGYGVFRRLLQYAKHYTGTCEGTGMVMGRECYLCFKDACEWVERKRKDASS